MSNMSERIREILGEHARLPVDLSTLADNDDLYDAGMTSHASVQVMLALEEGFDVEFPDFHADSQRLQVDRQHQRCDQPD